MSGWVAGATVVAAGVSAYSNNRASSRAARATQGAADSANAELARQYDLSRQDLAPYRWGGQQAYNTMLNELGLTPYGAAAGGVAPGAPGATGGSANPNLTGLVGGAMRGGSPLTTSPEGTPLTSRWADLAAGEGSAPRSWFQMVGQLRDRAAAAGQPGPEQEPPGTIGSFRASPGYQFVRDEGQRGVLRSVAGRTGLSSGATLRALDQFNSGLASQEYGNWWNRLAATSGIGQTATQQGAALGANYAGNAAANTMTAGDARASSYLTNAANNTNAINAGLNTWMLYRNGYFTPPTAGGGSGGYGSYGGGR